MSSTTTTPVLVSVDQELVIEAVALVFSAADVFAAQAGRQDTPLSGFFMQEASDLQRKFFGSKADLEDADWDTDPLEVEIQARANWLTADALEANLERGLIEAYRKHSRDMREAGRVGVDFDNALADERGDDA